MGRTWTAGLLLVLCVPLTAACGGATSDPDPNAAEPHECGTCASETEALGEVVAGIDGVRRLEDITYVTERGISRVASVRVIVDVARGSVDDVAQAVAEAGWKSTVAPLSAINLVTTEPGGKPEETRIIYRQNEEEQYIAEWGPRPTE